MTGHDKERHYIAMTHNSANSGSRAKRRHRWLSGLWVWMGVLLMLSACEDQQAVQEKESPRAVAIQELHYGTPRAPAMRSGSVESWKQEDIGFEVAGRVRWIIESGSLVEGELYDEEGVLLEQGQLLGRLEERRYRLRLSGIESRISSAESKVKGLETVLEEIIPEEIEQAEARYDLAGKTLERLEKLYADAAVAENELDEARTEFETASAARQSAIARRATTQADLNAARASVDQLDEERNSALMDLEDTRLYAPFSGQVAETHVIPGGYASPGRPAVTMVVMDPLRVVVHVSAHRDQQLARGSLVRVHLEDLEEPMEGWVYVKDTVADPVTRTYAVKILVRNRRIPAGPLPEEAEKLPRIDALRRPQYRLPELGKDLPTSETLYAPVEALVESGGRHYVFAARSRDSENRRNPQVLELSRIEVVPGGKRVNLLGLYIYRELQDAPGLSLDTDLVLNPDSSFEDGERVVLAPERWLLRPGDIVDVELDRTEIEPGFYVPIKAILESAQGERSVLIVDADNRARRIPVTAGRAVGNLQRIEGDALEEGMRLVIEGGAWLEDGDAVRIVSGDQVLP